MRGSSRNRRSRKRLTRNGWVKKTLIIVLMIISVVVVALLISQLPL